MINTDQIVVGAGPSGLPGARAGNNGWLTLRRPKMQIHRHTRILAAAALVLSGASAEAALQPTMELTDGALASEPITTGVISVDGVTATGAPIIGGPNQFELELGGSVETLVSPLTIELTEFNLSGGPGLFNFTTSIDGTLSPMSSIDWSAYYDPTNTPFGEGQLLASKNFADPSKIVSLGFFAPGDAAGSVSGPFSLTEVLTFNAQPGATLAFQSSIAATPVPELSTWAMMLFGFAGCGFMLRRTRKFDASAGEQRQRPSPS